MTNLIITVDESKKKLKFTGDKIALGERVAVEVVGIDVGVNTRLRVLVGDTTIAINGAWNGANCELNLFTVQAEKIHCGYGRIVLDDPEAHKLYGIGELELLPWPKERGNDVPYDLGNYPDVIEDFRNEIKEKFTEQDSEIESALRNIEDDDETFKNEQLERQNTFEETVNSNVANKADVAALEEEISARKNADNALSARINTNKTNIEANAANISKANTAIEKEVSDRVKTVEAEKQSRLVAEGGIRESISAEIARAKAAEAKVENKINTIVADDANKSARTIAAEEVAKVVANAPQDLDTLKEIANYIESDKTGAAQMLTQIDANAKAISDEVERAKKAESALGEALTKKVDAEDGKGLSSNDFTNEDKAKLDSLSTGTAGGYKLVDVGEDGLLLDRASNHATEERNTRDIWKTVDGVVVPSDKFTFDASSGRIEYEEYGTRVIATIQQFDFDNPLLPDGSYEFYGGRTLAQGEATFTPTQVSTSGASGSWTGDATWLDPTSGEERATKITNGSFYGFSVRTPSATAGQPIHIAEGAVGDYVPTVGEVVDVWEAYDENGEDITSTVKVVISSVTTTSANGSATGILSFPEYGLNANVGVSWYTDDKAFDVDYNFVTPGKELSALFLSFPLSSVPIKGEVYYNNVSEITVLCSFTKSFKAELIPPGPAPDRLRDFIVVFEAKTDGLNVEMPGVKEADEDVLKLEKGRNAIFVTEYVQGVMYATRRLLEAPVS